MRQQWQAEFRWLTRASETPNIDKDDENSRWGERSYQRWWTASRKHPKRLKQQRETYWGRGDKGAKRVSTNGLGTDYHTPTMMVRVTVSEKHMPQRFCQRSRWVQPEMAKAIITHFMCIFCDVASDLHATATYVFGYVVSHMIKLISTGNSGIVNKQCSDTPALPQWCQ